MSVSCGKNSVNVGAMLGSKLYGLTSLHKANKSRSKLLCTMDVLNCGVSAKWPGGNIKIDFVKNDVVLFSYQIFVFHPRAR